MPSSEHISKQFDVELESLRSRKAPVCGIHEAHISTASLQLANISYRTGRALNVDPKTETFTSDAVANKMLTRNYRAPYVVPAKV